MGEEKRTYKEFVQKDLVFFKRTTEISPKTILFYFAFAKDPFFTLLSPEFMKKMRDEIEGLDIKLMEKLGKDIKFNTRKYSAEAFATTIDTYLHKKVAAMISPGMRPLGYAKVHIFLLSDMPGLDYDRELDACCEKIGLSEKDKIARIFYFFPLSYVSDRHEKRGVGSKMLWLILTDLKEKGVKLVYVYPSEKGSGLFKESNLFKPFWGTTGFRYMLL